MEEETSPIWEFYSVGSLLFAVLEAKRFDKHKNLQYRIGYRYRQISVGIYNGLSEYHIGASLDSVPHWSRGPAIFCFISGGRSKREGGGSIFLVHSNEYGWPM